ncbi:SRPBCC domain-containing protein [Neisseriaceae bacterium JH1-16]|nr:SRPBCC domain-containing protein [Neisseriaceae bacterium JH1-16]
MAASPAVRWPDRYHPARCPVHVRNQLDMAAAPARVWAWLIRAPLWPSWYANAAQVRPLDGSGQDLRAGSRFRWKTFGITITSTVLEYVPGERIGWDAYAFGVDAYHAWVLQPSERGCLVLTEETQHGWLARLSNLAMPRRMHKYHQLWLEQLEAQARSGLPPTV